MSVTEREAPVVTPIEIAEPNEVQRLLLEARDVIADEKNWTKGMYHSGRVCAIGAVARAQGWGPEDEDYDEGVIYERFDQCPASRYLAAAAREIRGPASSAEAEAGNKCALVFRVNDHDGHAAVLGMFNRAIALAGEST